MSILKTAFCPLPVEASSLTALVLKLFLSLFFFFFPAFISFGFSWVFSLGFFTPFLKYPSPHWAAPTSSMTIGAQEETITPKGNSGQHENVPSQNLLPEKNKQRLWDFPRSRPLKWSSVYPRLKIRGSGTHLVTALIQRNSCFYILVSVPRIVAIMIF